MKIFKITTDNKIFYGIAPNKEIAKVKYKSRRYFIKSIANSKYSLDYILDSNRLHLIY